MSSTRRIKPELEIAEEIHEKRSIVEWQKDGSHRLVRI